MRKLYSLCVLALFLTISGMNPVAAQDNWSRFRGPNGTGISELHGVPTGWKAEDYEWVVELPGKGHSSPAVWGDRLFITTGSEQGERQVVCLNALTGKQLWSKAVPMAANHLHKKNSYGSGTPAVDGERVYVAEADEEHFIVIAYTLAGEKVWQRDLGPFQSAHGFGVSPIVYEDKLIVANDQAGPSSIVALDLKTGEVRWRPSRKIVTAAYATPMILNVHGKDQIIALSGATGLAGLDPANGNELWATGEMPQRTVASPVFGNGMLIATCGSGGRGKYMIAVNPENAGSKKPLVQFERKQSLPYVPTPVIFGQYLFFWNDDGIVCCVDMQGDLNQNVWRERVGGNYSGSPVIIDGKIYCISEDGDVKVLDAGPQFHQYEGGHLGDPSYSTPAIANGRVYLRSFHKLFSLKAKSNVVGAK